LALIQECARLKWVRRPDTLAAPADMSEPLDNSAPRAVRIGGLLKALGGLAVLCLLWRFGVIMAGTG
jgi:hypothetical protein